MFSTMQMDGDGFSRSMTTLIPFSTISWTMGEAEINQSKSVTWLSQSLLSRKWGKASISARHGQMRR